MRARQPDLRDDVVRDGVRIAYEVYDNHGPTVLLMPTWSIIDSRHWKLQLPYLARHFRVVIFDGRGNGASDRPTAAAAYADREFVADAVAVLDATETDRAVVAGLSKGGHWAGLLAGLHPDRVSGAILIGAAVSLLPRDPARTVYPWDQELDTDEGWAKYNKHYWRRHYRDFTEFFFSQALSEPHSTKQREDAVEWASETDAETLITTEMADEIGGEEERRVLESIRCPVLLIHGTDDRIRPHASSQYLAELVGGTLLTIEGGGHCPQARDPVIVNRAMRRFVESVNRVSARELSEVRS
ncbi:MAG TPA: alpha/beta hydrolase [Acidimicrobiia bacterium]|nr:alpha/beta hydrolase [Acidimicrobiia bacterium]